MKIDLIILGTPDVPSLPHSNVLHKGSFRMTTCRRYVLEKRRDRKTKKIRKDQECVIEANRKKRSDTHKNT